jgi:alkyl sulfatase BDS1-like metallo-beta-lactamase superfamily hydrolase
MNIKKQHALIPLLVVMVFVFLSSCSREQPSVELGVAAKELAEHTKEFRKEVIRITDGVYVAIGYGLANSILLEGEDGVVIVDTMESYETAQDVKKAFDKITRKPVKALIYTHFHADHIFGAQAFAGNRRVDVYSHETTLAGIDRFTTITRDITYIRAMRMFGTYLPEEMRENCGIGPFLGVGPDTRFALIRPNKTFAGKRMNLAIAGMKLELIFAPGETDDQIVVWLPDKRVLVCADDYYKSFPNLYTIRGTKYRDVNKWAETLNMIRELRAEYLVPCHSRPITGAEKIYEVLTDYRDAVKFVHDQTIRYINMGLTPDEIVEKVKLPPHLIEKPYLREYYGTVAWSVKNIFNGYLGWFSGNATDLNPLSPRERAVRFAKLAGGEKALLEKAREALDQKDYQWVLTLCDQLIQLDYEKDEAVKMKAASLRVLGLKQGNANARYYYLTRALELEGKIDLTPPKVRKDTVVFVPLDAIFSGMAVKLNSEKSADVDTVVTFRFPDTRDTYSIHVRRGVAWIENRLPAKADISVTVNSTVWKEVVAGIRNPAVALARGDVKVDGGVLNLVKFLGLFSD